ncbi:HAD family hydrolase [Streptomyces sp. NPDC060035]|uniref:HAD family hydrolase n=1 Tax=Streptomyces sp. NPDC060035 TaxID=3347044 RepID=UPI0036CF84AD
MSAQVLVLWDIDRTLLYVGDIDRQVYRETFYEVTGRTAERFPKRGTGMTMPLAIRDLLLDNGIPEDEAVTFLPTMVELLPQVLRRHTDDIRRDGVLMPGAVAALRAVRSDPSLLPTIVTGNLKPNALVKLDAFELTRYVVPDIGGYASDDMHRPALVGVAQKRAEVCMGQPFDRTDTVIIGDSLEDVRTGREGGAVVIAVASGTTDADDLTAAGADLVLEDLTDPGRLIESIHSLTG